MIDKVWKFSRELQAEGSDAQQIALYSFGRLSRRFHRYGKGIYRLGARVRICILY